MKVVHVSWLKRSDGERGGVEKFAHYLQRALQEAGHQCQVVSWNDYPAQRASRSLNNPDKALVMGSWVEAEVDFDVAVSDGYWGLGINAKPVVPVIHGTWAQFHLNMGASPWANAEVRAQHDAFNAPNAFPVACSPAAARELELHHRRKPAATILHGVDLEVFRPRWSNEAENIPEIIPPQSGKPLVLHAATNDKKGQLVMPAIARQLQPDFSVAFLGAEVGQEANAFRRGEIFLHPSKHEGNAYALLEALATGLPVVTTSVGLFESVDDKAVGRVLSGSATVSQWAAAVREVWGDGSEPYTRYAREARSLAESIADYQKFKRNWLEFLGGLPS